MWKSSFLIVFHKLHLHVAQGAHEIVSVLHLLQFVNNLWEIDSLDIPHCIGSLHFSDFRWSYGTRINKKRRTVFYFDSLNLDNQILPQVF